MGPPSHSLHVPIYSTITTPPHCNTPHPTPPHTPPQHHTITPHHPTQSYQESTDGSFIETKASALVWHYRDADPDFGHWQAKELLDHLEGVLSNQPVEVASGQAIVEVKPQVWGWCGGCGGCGVCVCLLDDHYERVCVCMCLLRWCFMTSAQHVESNVSQPTLYATTGTTQPPTQRNHWYNTTVRNIHTGCVQGGGGSTDTVRVHSKWVCTRFCTMCGG